MLNVIGGYSSTDIEFVVGFDVDKRKVDKPLTEAIYSDPNCCMKLVDSVPDNGAKVYMGHVLDGVAEHMDTYPEHQSFRLSTVKPVDVVALLHELEVDVLISYMPVGSEEAAKFYAECALEAKVGFVNNMPVFIASVPELTPTAYLLPISLAKFFSNFFSGFPSVNSPVGTNCLSLNHKSLALLNCWDKYEYLTFIKNYFKFNDFILLILK